MKNKLFRKIVTVFATSVLLFNSLAPSLLVLAQEVTPSPTPEATIAPTDTASPTATSDATPAETASPTPDSTSHTASPTAQPTDQPIVTQAPESNPTVQGPPGTDQPTVSPTATPVFTPVELEKEGNLSTITVENIDLSAISLLNSNVDVPTVVTDKADYSPTSMVLITGTGFTANNSYTLVISSTDEPPVTASDRVTADSQGVFTYAYQLDGNYRPNYKIEIKSGEVIVASTTFTDSINTITIGAQSPNPVSPGNSATYTVTTKAQGNNHDTKITSVSGLPTGATFSSDCVISKSNASTHNTLTINTTGSTPVGTQTLTLTITMYEIATGVCTGTTNDTDNTHTTPFSVNSAPTNINLTANSIAENQPSNTAVGNLTTVDSNVGDSFTYTLVSGTGSTDNASFNISGANLRSSTIFDYETKSSYTIRVRTTDQGGLYFEKQFTVNITDVADSDITPPVISKVITGTAGTNGWYTGNVSLVWTVTDAQSAVIIDSGCGTQNFTSETTGTNSVCSAHSVGGSSNDSVNIKIDKTGPSANLVITAGTPGSSGWYKSNVTVATSCFDAVSAITSYTSDQFQNTDTSGHVFNGSCTNWAGLSTNAAPLTVKLDKTIPTVSAGSNQSKNALFTQAGSASDSTSSIATLAWTKQSGPGIVTFGSSNAASTTISANVDGTCVLRLTATDNAGNTNFSEFTLIWDTTPPVITITNPTTASAQSKTITASASDGTLTMSNTTGSTCNGSLSFISYSSQTFTSESDNDKKVCYKAVDTLGNTTYLMSSAIAGIDRTAPTATVSYSTTAWTNGDVVAIIHPSETVTVTNNGGFTTHDFTSNGSFTFNFTDLAGNTGSKTATVSNIDKITPTLESKTTFSGWYTSDQISSFTYSDSGSGIASGNPATCTILTEGVSQTCTSTPNVCDIAGNCNTAEVESNGADIDKTSPDGVWINPLTDTTISGLVNLNYEATDDLSGVGEKVFGYKLDDGIDVFHEITGTDWDTTSLSLGDYILRVIVWDNAGNSYESQINVGVAAVISAESSNTFSTFGANITWITDRPTSTRVVYDTVQHPVVDLSDPNYGYTYSTVLTDSSPEVYTHNVTITGLTDGTLYYYRVVSAGSPTAIGSESGFKTYGSTGAPGSTGGSAVLGVSTTAGSWPRLAYAGTKGSVEKVLGTETKDSSSQAAEVSQTSQTEKLNVITWVSGHKKISLAIILVLIASGYYLSKRNNK